MIVNGSCGDDGGLNSVILRLMGAGRWQDNDTDTVTRNLIFVYEVCTVYVKNGGNFSFLRSKFNNIAAARVVLRWHSSIIVIR